MNTHMYRLFMTNFGYFAQETFDTFEDAFTAAKRKGFETSIVFRNKEGIDTTVAAYSPIGGLRTFSY